MRTSHAWLLCLYTLQDTCIFCFLSSASHYDLGHACIFQHLTMIPCTWNYMSQWCLLIDVKTAINDISFSRRCSHWPWPMTLTELAPITVHISLMSRTVSLHRSKQSSVKLCLLFSVSLVWRSPSEPLPQDSFLVSVCVCVCVCMCECVCTHLCAHCGY